MGFMTELWGDPVDGLADDKDGLDTTEGGDTNELEVKVDTVTVFSALVMPVSVVELCAELDCVEVAVVLTGESKPETAEEA